MLGGLIKPSWQSESAEKRRLAVLKMNTEDANQAIFEKLALEDPDQGVRLACVKQLQVVASVFSVYQLQIDEQTKSAAKTRFCHLIGSNSDLSEAQFETLLSEHNAASILVAQHCPHPSLRIRLIETFSQTEQAEAIAEIQYADTRLHIAKQLDHMEALKIARRNLKGKDKSAEKVIRTKLEKYLAQQKLDSDTNERALELCERMEFIANHPAWRSEFKDKYLRYTQRWSALELSLVDGLMEPVTKRFSTAANKAKPKVEQQIETENTEHNQTQIVNKLEHYCAKLAPLSLLELADQRSDINTMLGEVLDVWLENIAIVAADSALETRMSNAQQALTSLLKLIESTLTDDIDLNVLVKEFRRTNLANPATLNYPQSPKRQRL